MTTESTTQAAGENTPAAGGEQTTDQSAQPVNATTPPAPADGAKPADAPTTTQNAQPEAEIAYEFKLPEGMALDAKSTEDFKALAKELKLPADAAQRLVDIEVTRMQAQAEAHVATVKEWRETVVNDPVLGGDHLAENMAIAKKAVALGPPELNDLLKSTGMDNHPVVFRWALAVGKALSEDKHVQAGGNAGAVKSAAQVLYPSNS